MGIEITFANDVTNADERARGSDGRLNVSARADARAYYNSRDKQNAFTLSWEDASTATNDFVLYWKNTAVDGRHLVIDRIEIGVVAKYADWILHTANNETAAGGTATTPFCLNVANPRVAPATARTADSSTISTVTANLVIARTFSPAGAAAIMKFNDMLRLGQDQAILLECQAIETTARTFGTAYGYYE